MNTSKFQQIKTELENSDLGIGDRVAWIRYFGDKEKPLAVNAIFLELLGENLCLIEVLDVKHNAVGDGIVHKDNLISIYCADNFVFKKTFTSSKFSKKLKEKTKNFFANLKTNLTKK